MIRRRRYHERDPDEVEEFETPALRQAAGQEERQPRAGRAAPADDSYSEVDSQSESGLGCSEDDLEEDALAVRGHSSDDYDDAKDNSEDSDSDAPEDISQKTQQEVEENRMKNILDSIRKEREQQKDKRRKKDSLFKLQKQEKLAALEKRKLPDDLLDEIADTPTIKKKMSAQLPTKVSKTDSDQVKEDDDDVDIVDEGAGEDFIPLAETTVGTKMAVVLLTKGRKEKTDKNTAADLSRLKRNMLHGCRNKRISSVRVRLSVEKKRVGRVK